MSNKTKRSDKPDAEVMEEFLQGKANKFILQTRLNSESFQLEDEETSQIKRLIKRAIKSKNEVQINILSLYIYKHKNLHLLNIFPDEKINLENVFEFLKAFNTFVFVKTEKPDKNQENFFSYLIERLTVYFESQLYCQDVLEQYTKLLLCVDKSIAKNLFQIIKKKTKKFFEKKFFIKFLNKIVENLEEDDISFFVNFYMKKLSKFSQISEYYGEIIDLFIKILTSPICEKPEELFLKFEFFQSKFLILIFIH